uniref:Uncharacterized protein n=1 Tax=Arundo donax TaxID=35708 RepID=A0A0A8YH85_ARUDO
MAIWRWSKLEMHIYCCPRKKHPIGFEPISEGPAWGTLSLYH